MVGRGKKFFRNWVQGAEQNAGAWGRDEMRNISGEINPTGNRYTILNTDMAATGAFAIIGPNAYRTSFGTSDESTRPKTLRMDASLVVPTGPQNVPQHVWQPVMLYLGRPA